jgi:hypothetical protein
MGLIGRILELELPDSAAADIRMKMARKPNQAKMNWDTGYERQTSVSCFSHSV